MPESDEPGILLQQATFASQTDLALLQYVATVCCRPLEKALFPDCATFCANRPLAAFRPPIGFHLPGCLHEVPFVNDVVSKEQGLCFPPADALDYRAVNPRP